MKPKKMTKKEEKALISSAMRLLAQRPREVTEAMVEQRRNAAKKPRPGRKKAKGDGSPIKHSCGSARKVRQKKK